MRRQKRQLHQWLGASPNTRRARRRISVLSLVTALAVIGAACSSSSKSTSSGTTAPASSSGSSGSSAGASTGSGPWGWPGNSTTGYLPPNEPHVKGKGTVTVGLITAGDIHDQNYYQSEVDAINQYVKTKHWKSIIDGNVNPAQAAQAAETLCSEGVDLLVIGESELAGAGPAASSSQCKDTPAWAYASAGTMSPSKYYYLAQDLGTPQSYTAGYAFGLWMKANHQTKAGFIGGPNASFVTAEAQALLAGMRAVIPSASLVTTYTGDFNASGPALTASKAMVSSGIKIVWPYLGGAFYPASRYLAAHGVALPSDGGSLCSSTNPKFAIDTVFNPGYYLMDGLKLFSEGQLRVGVTKTYNLYSTPIPNVQFCPSSGLTNLNPQLNALMKKFGTGQLNVDNVVKNTKV
ncbi:MAG: BMP family ABC transporter substrate-binding protein [Acidimicrobiaceae bacterium]|nr:BMP family ABC transporter substrate-binding protein [Acidimicrobiaceae bacterium]